MRNEREKKTSEIGKSNRKKHMISPGGLKSNSFRNLVTQRDEFERKIFSENFDSRIKV